MAGNEGWREVTDLEISSYCRCVCGGKDGQRRSKDPSISILYGTVTEFRFFILIPVSLSLYISVGTRHLLGST